MGLDTQLYISPDWRIEDVRDVLRKRYPGMEVQLKFHEWAPDYLCLLFQLPGSESKRMLHMHRNTHVAGFPATLLEFASNKEGQEVLITLAKTFGGFFQEADHDDEFTAFRKPGTENIDFVMREALKDDPKLLDSKDKELASYIIEEKWMPNKKKGAKK